MDAVRPRQFLTAASVMVVFCTGCVAEPAGAAAPAVTPGPTPVGVTLTIGRFSASDLPYLVNGTSVPTGTTLEVMTLGDEALETLLPAGFDVPAAGFLGARSTRLRSTATRGYLVTWSAVYETEGAASRAFGTMFAAHASDRGWHMQEVGDPELGDVSVTLDGAAHGFQVSRVHLWRTRNLLLAAGSLGFTAATPSEVEQLNAMANGLQARAHQLLEFR